MNEFFELCKNGVIEKINEFLRDKCFDPSVENNFAIRRAAEYGQIAVVERLLRVKACANYAIRDCKGNAAVIKRQVQVDPSADNNYAVRFAARNGHLAHQPATMTPSDWLLRTAMLLSSTDCCKMNALTHQRKTTVPSDGLLTEATSRSLIDCSKIHALI